MDRTTVAGRNAEFSPSVGVVTQRVDRVAEPMEFALTQQHGTADLGQPLDIVGLVIVG